MHVSVLDCVRERGRRHVEEGGEHAHSRRSVGSRGGRGGSLRPGRTSSGSIPTGGVLLCDRGLALPCEVALRAEGHRCAEGRPWFPEAEHGAFPLVREGGCCAPSVPGGCVEPRGIDGAHADGRGLEPVQPPVVETRCSPPWRRSDTGRVTGDGVSAATCYFELLAMSPLLEGPR